MLASPGWQRFRQYVDQEWGPAAYRRHVRAALQGLAAGPHADSQAQQTVLQIEATVNAIEHLIAWPAHRLKGLQNERERETYRRGGY